MKRFRCWLAILLVLVIPVTGLASAGIGCCNKDSAASAPASHEHQSHEHQSHEQHMHHHGASDASSGKSGASQACHCAHCAMGCGSGCVIASIAAPAIQGGGIPLAIDVSRFRAVPAHHLDPFRPPIRRA